MPDVINYWPLLGVGVVVAGFALRRNPVLVVVIAGIVSALAAGMSVADLLALLGRIFVENRMLLLFLLILPVIGLLEHYGLRERARSWIAGFRGLTLTRFQVTYLGLRQLLSMAGLTHVAGHPQTVRPLVAPMSEAAAERRRRTDRREARGGQGLLRGDRQCRPLLRRGYLPRDRFDPADEGPARRLWL